ncbi:hypothetical protein SCHPADRAFT_947702 [Schizopora paradoxa]|uniref:Uncharacterized protein n=1 Tax=Schizopora paradoxa TaxID=27342 RepID=A0A0H2RHY9_9AGAM|nr:hypothetical protein SCHPADRAFT_947702 [Schizopora paradoxa]
MFSRQHQPQSPEAHSNIEVINLTRAVSVLSIDSDATIDNQPGAGRTLGLLFAWLGSKLEKALNRRAERLGLGPSAIAGKIRHRAGHDNTTFIQRLTFLNRKLSRTDRKALRKLCNKLIEHARSHIKSNQLIALGEIVELAIEDPQIRIILASCDLDRLATHYEEPDVLIATTRALGAVEFSIVHHVWAPILSLQSFEPSYPNKDNDAIKELVKVSKGEILKTLSNEYTSFLSARYLRRALGRIRVRFLLCDSLETLLCDSGSLYTKIARRSPESIEWPNFHSCILPYAHEHHHDGSARVFIRKRQVLTLAESLDAVTFMHYTKPFLLQYFPAPKVEFIEEDLGEILQNGESLFQVWKWPLGIDELKTLISLLTYLTKSPDYLSHLSFLGHLSNDMKSFLKGTILVDKIFSVYCILFSHVYEEAAHHSIREDILKDMCTLLVNFMET